MNLNELFIKSVTILKDRKIKFALAGGMVASLYRTQSRTTTDVDYLIHAGAETDEIAQNIILELGLKPMLVRQAQLEGGPKFAIKNKSSPLFIVVGRPENKQDEIGLDFILPRVPWFATALERAQENLIDYGFDRIPCLTAEDIIISKFYSLRNDASRAEDLSDLISIFSSGRSIDLVYIASQMKALQLVVPLSFEQQAPNILLTVSKNIRREIRKAMNKNNKFKNI